MCFITFSCLWKQDNHWHHSGDKGERWADWDERQEVEWKERREVEKEVRETKRRKGWEARDRKQLTFMFLVNRKCHFELASLHPLLLHLTQGSPTTLASIPITQMWPPLFRHYFPASPFFYFYRSTAWPSFTCCHFHITDHHLCHIRTTLQLSTLIFFPQILTSNLFLPIPLFASLPFFLLANPPTFRSHLQCAFLGLSRWWDSYSLPDEALANGCWIMHGARI